MPIEVAASTYRMPTGRSVSCSGVRCPKIDTSLSAGPNGTTAIARNAGMVEISGATKKTILSAAVGMMSSLSISFTPSASDWSMPQGPVRLGPMRCCM